VDISQNIDALTQVLVEGKARALGSGAVVDRESALRIVDQIKESMPSELLAAQELLDKAESIRDAATAQAQEVLNQAKEQATALASEHEVVAQAQTQAHTIVSNAHAVADQKKAEIDAYVDAKLAAFEGNLQQTLAAVAAGREKLAGERVELARHEGDTESPAANSV
jgi:cell division septum initiation protein DivIVA